MWTVLTSATDDTLVSLADCKEAMDITDAADDAKLTRFIRRATAQIESYCDRPLLSQVYQAAVPSYGGRRLQLPHHPIRAVLRVFDGTDTGTATALTSTEYKVDYERGWLTRDEGFPWTYQSFPEVSPFPENRQEYDRWLVEYSAGYVPPKGKDTGSTGDGTTSTGPTVPLDLQDAAIGLVRSKWLARTRDQSIASKSVGELSVSYRGANPSSSNQSGLPDDVAALLAPYRSLA